VIPSTARNYQESDFLNLPPEIRNLIYNFVVTEPPTIRIRKNQRPSNIDLRLLRVCRQIYAETAALPYAANVFEFSDLPTLVRWQRGRELGQLAAIKVIKVDEAVEQITEDGDVTREPMTDVITAHGAIKAETNYYDARYWKNNAVIVAARRGLKIVMTWVKGGRGAEGRGLFNI
jgi:hypothetical protein